MHSASCFIIAACFPLFPAMRICSLLTLVDMVDILKMFPLKLADAQWRALPKTIRDGPFPIVLDGWTFDEPLVPLGRIVERVTVGPHPKTRDRDLVVTPLPFSLYRT